MKSMIIGGNLVPPYGINCDAKILDTILRKEKIISVKKKKTTRIRYKLSIINPLEISYIKGNGLKMKGWKQICCFCCLDAQSCPTLLRPLWNHPGKTAGVCYHALLQGISPPRDQNRVSASPTPQEILHC